MSKHQSRAQRRSSKRKHAAEIQIARRAAFRRYSDDLRARSFDLLRLAVASEHAQQYLRATLTTVVVTPGDRYWLTNDSGHVRASWPAVRQVMRQERRAWRAFLRQRRSWKALTFLLRYGADPAALVRVAARRAQEGCSPTGRLPS